jgi:hypothetical protein
LNLVLSFDSVINRTFTRKAKSPGSVCKPDNSLPALKIGRTVGP